MAGLYEGSNEPPGSLKEEKRREEKRREEKRREEKRREEKRREEKRREEKRRGIKSKMKKEMRRKARKKKIRKIGRREREEVGKVEEKGQKVEDEREEGTGKYRETKMRRDRIDYEGSHPPEFIPEGRTVTKELYVEILRRLRDAVRRKRPEKWVENNWFLMHDNAPAHRAIIVKNFLARHNITALDHPPYSPDLSPPDYFLFLRLKSHLKGRRFNAEEVIANATRALKRVSKMASRPASRNSKKVCCCGRQLF
ncbi:hypothetical protein ANN_04112 [Periplaneta americana]|uniref:Tc1-like transposase DDE domain-containing protein n=1 Tax=Periplaneta americana TaxID=6978 RepID=A0ABQ8T7N8_PERAM|nr:hypothetical protein ANN_04112 [Periplaneta americana]